MFRSLGYCNTEKIHQYYSIITRQKRLNVQNVSVSNEKGANLNLSVIGANVSGKTTIDATMEENLNIDYDIFEKSLIDRDDYFDTLKDDYDLSTVPTNSIIKFQANMSIPEEFDMIQLLEQFKPMLLGQASSSMDVDVYNFMEKALEKDEINIPCLFQLSDILCYGKIHSNFLMTSYEDLEEFESEEITILAKVLSHKKGINVIYDPLKDFIKINRAMRRLGDMDKLPKEFSSIKINDEALSLEILAIYQ